MLLIEACVEVELPVQLACMLMDSGKPVFYVILTTCFFLQNHTDDIDKYLLQNHTDDIDKYHKAGGTNQAKKIKKKNVKSTRMLSTFFVLYPAFYQQDNTLLFFLYIKISCL
jgi:hypothetical protein